MNITVILEKLKKIFAANKKITLICILGLIGITLIFLSEVTKDINTDKEPVSEETQVADEDYTKQLEERLTDIISSIEYAGTTKVMVTLETVSENIYASNEKSNSSEKSSSYQNDYIIIDKDDGEGGLIIKEKQPQIKGVAVVCQGETIRL